MTMPSSRSLHIWTGEVDRDGICMLKVTAKERRERKGTGKKKEKG